MIPLSGREIDKEFVAILQEGFASGYLAQASAVHPTNSFTEHYGSVTTFLESDHDAGRLVDEVLQGVPRHPVWERVGEPDYTQMEIFVAMLVHTVMTDVRWRSLGDRLVDTIEEARPDRWTSLTGLMGIAAIDLYYHKFPLSTAPGQGVAA